MNDILCFLIGLIVIVEMRHEGKRQVASSRVSSEDDLCELRLALWFKKTDLQDNLHQKVYTRK